jgi:hypothetical protein
MGVHLNLLQSVPAERTQPHTLKESLQTQAK